MPGQFWNITDQSKDLEGHLSGQERKIIPSRLKEWIESWSKNSRWQMSRQF